MTPDPFWNQTRRVEDCLIWRGTRTGEGYGRLRVDGIRTLAHVHAYRLTHGSVPRGAVVQQMCDNRPCVNPEHLRLAPSEVREAALVRPSPGKAKKPCSRCGGPREKMGYARKSDLCNACRRAEAEAPQARVMPASVVRGMEQRQAMRDFYRDHSPLVPAIPPSRPLSPLATYGRGTCVVEGCPYDSLRSSDFCRGHRTFLTHLKAEVEAGPRAEDSQEPIAFGLPG